MIPTPGHSAHHISYAVDDLLFAGEAGGVCLIQGRQQKPYMRPATPPRFFLDVALESLDRLIALRPRKIAHSHFGLFNNAKERLLSHREQLLLWRDVIGRVLSGDEAEDLTDECLKKLLQTDAHLGPFNQMTGHEKVREKDFLRNSIQGFLGYLQGQGSGR